MTPNQVPALLFVLAFILILTRVLGMLARRFDQPSVIGEILAGILVGPTLFQGAIANALFPTDIRPHLAALANVGLALFMFLVGMEFDHDLARGRMRTTITVALTSMLLPFGLGALLALRLLDDHPTAHRVGFVLFMSAAMSVTAFPVLARILTDRGMLRTPLGGLALSCAAIADVLAWSILAGIVAVVGGNGRPQWLVVFVVPFAIVMLAVVRPLLRRWASGPADRGRGLFVIALAGLLLSGALTEWMGLHFIFGAFLFGLIMPRDVAGGASATIRDGLERLGATLLMPVYFIIAGLQVDLSTVDAAGAGEFALIMLVAVGGKFGGVYLSAWLNRTDWRQAAGLATLMNARGLTELVILTLGRQLGVLDQRLYSLMVVMALVTTAMTGPLLRWLYPSQRITRDFLSAAKPG